MKNWKFIKTGNTAHSDKVDVIKRLLAGGWSVQDIYEQLKTEGYEVEKNFIEKLKTGNMKNDAKSKELFEKMMDAKDIYENWGRMSSSSKDDLSGGLKAAKDAYIKAKREYEQYSQSDEHVKNESINKQVWSMFKGLSKDAEKEVGNKAIVLKDGNVWVVLYANETKSQEFESEEEAREFAKKVGNSLPHDYHNRYPSDPIYADMKSSATLEAIKKEPWRVYDIMGVGDSLARERVFEMIEEKYKIDYNDIYEAWMGHSWDKAVQKKSMEEAKRLAQKLGLRFGNKTGNADTVSEYNAEIQRLTKKAEQLRRMGQGKSAMEVEKQIEKLGRELRELGNSKTGNETLGQWAKAKPRIINETKGERKFGKVMGEFERGELKSGSGEKVTDPAQAKAIAYSEADKVDNLKRARNAMAKNQKITLWKGNDTVYISEDGTVQYLENNSFETDRDKFESKEKAIEELTKQGYRNK